MIPFLNILPIDHERLGKYYLLISPVWKQKKMESGDAWIINQEIHF
jgi:hypothetical protein